MMQSRAAMVRTLLTCAGLAWLGAVCIEGAQTSVRLKPDTTAASPARELVAKYCVTCHNERLKTASLLLDKARDEIANDSEFGLSAGVFTADLEHGIAIAERIRSGTVGVNNLGFNMAFPFGGYRQSGNGRDKSLHALEKYTELKSTLLRLR